MVQIGHSMCSVLQFLRITQLSFPSLFYRACGLNLEFLHGVVFEQWSQFEMPGIICWDLQACLLAKIWEKQNRGFSIHWVFRMDQALCWALPLSSNSLSKQALFPLYSWEHWDTGNVTTSRSPCSLSVVKQVSSCLSTSWKPCLGRSIQDQIPQLETSPIYLLFLEEGWDGWCLPAFYDNI